MGILVCWIDGAIVTVVKLERCCATVGACCALGKLVAVDCGAGDPADVGVEGEIQGDGILLAEI